MQHRYLFDCNETGSVFLHLFQHLQKNDNNILKLLSCQNNELFLGYFKSNLIQLIKNERYLFDSEKNKKVPENFWINHVCATFVERTRWWVETGMKESPETLTEYFTNVL